MWNIIWGVVVVLFAIWLLDFIFHFAGGLIHVLLVIILILIAWNLFISARKKQNK